MIFNIYIFVVWWQESAAAIAEGKPAPALSESSDIRPLNFDDFKFAHEQVNNKPFWLMILLFFKKIVIH